MIWIPVLSNVTLLLCNLTRKKIYYLPLMHYFETNVIVLSSPLLYFFVKYLKRNLAECFSIITSLNNVMVYKIYFAVITLIITGIVSPGMDGLSLLKT